MIVILIILTCIFIAYSSTRIVEVYRKYSASKFKKLSEDFRSSSKYNYVHSETKFCCCSYYMYRSYLFPLNNKLQKKRRSYMGLFSPIGYIS